MQGFNGSQMINHAIWRLWAAGKGTLSCDCVTHPSSGLDNLPPCVLDGASVHDQAQAQQLNH